MRVSFQSKPLHVTPRSHYQESEMPNWIKASKRQPEKDGWYDVRVNGYHPQQQILCKFKDGKWVDMLGCSTSNIVAWLQED